MEVFPVKTRKPEWEEDSFKMGNSRVTKVLRFGIYAIYLARIRERGYLDGWRFTIWEGAHTRYMSEEMLLPQKEVMYEAEMWLANEVKEFADILYDTGDDIEGETPIEKAIAEWKESLNN